MSIQKTTKNDIDLFIKAHSKWQIKNGKLSKAFVFNNFTEAFGFMYEVALIAQHNDHHPEWFNVYKKVFVQLITHEAGGITKKDFELAKAMDKIASKEGLKF